MCTMYICEETPAIDIQYICTSTCICLKKWRNDISSKNMSLIPKKTKSNTRCIIEKTQKEQQQ